MTEKLKPCPFCGGEPTINLSLREPFVMCLGCHTSSPTCVTHEKAFAAWNRRTEALRPAEELKSLLREAAQWVERDPNGDLTKRIQAALEAPSTGEQG